MNKYFNHLYYLLQLSLTVTVLFFSAFTIDAYAQTQSIVSCSDSGTYPNKILSCTYTNGQASNFTCAQRDQGVICKDGSFFSPAPTCNTESWIENSSQAKNCSLSKNERFNCAENRCDCLSGYVRQGACSN
jgi:hypothetical protein